MESSSFYEFESSSELLRSVWERRQALKPSFSMRAWAKALGFKSNTPLSLMLSGHRKIPVRLIPDLIRTLQLDSNQGAFLENLIHYERAKKTSEKDFYYERLKAVRPKNTFSFASEEVFRSISNPLDSAILEMTGLEDFREDLTWIRERLRLSVTDQQIFETLERCELLNLLVRDLSGRLKRSHQILSSSPNRKSEAVQRYHRTAMKLAGDSLEHVPIELREFQSYSFNLKTHDLERAREELRTMIRNFFEKFEAREGQGDETYQLSVQFFPLTHTRKEKRKTKEKQK